MSVTEHCANCGAPLAPDRPGGGDYCAKCAAAWHRGNAAQEQGQPASGDGTTGRCANCGAPVEAAGSAGPQYCDNCSAAWNRGRTGGEKSGS